MTRFTKHALAFLLLAGIAAGFTMTHDHAYAKAKSASIQPTFQDGPPDPICPPLPAPCPGRP